MTRIFPWFQWDSVSAVVPLVRIGESPRRLNQGGEGAVAAIHRANPTFRFTDSAGLTAWACQADAEALIVAGAPLLPPRPILNLP